MQCLPGEITCDLCVVFALTEASRHVLITGQFMGHTQLYGVLVDILKESFICFTLTEALYTTEYIGVYSYLTSY